MIGIRITLTLCLNVAEVTCGCHYEAQKFLGQTRKSLWALAARELVKVVSNIKIFWWCFCACTSASASAIVRKSQTVVQVALRNMLRELTVHGWVITASWVYSLICYLCIFSIFALAQIVTRLYLSLWSQISWPCSSKGLNLSFQNLLCSVLYSSCNLIAIISTLIINCSNYSSSLCYCTN